MQNKTSEYMNKLINIFASFSEDQRRDIYNYFLSLYGKEFSNDMTTNYSVKGKAKNVSSPVESEQLSTVSWFNDDNIKLASKKTEEEKQYWLPLLGKEFAEKMVKVYKQNEAKKPKTTSGQTKVASKKKVR